MTIKSNAIPSKSQHNDPIIKKYATTIDRVLVTFEQIETWPDNIAFLNRLLKTIQMNPTLPVVRKREIAICLAFCVVPQLPAGVQQKALEVYSHIFASLGNLDKDLAIFLPGLIPLLGYASTPVKDNYITILSTFVIPMQQKLSGCLTSLILSLLPGLEDEQDESCASCLQVMNELQMALKNNDQFWAAFWYASLGVTGTQRAGILTYISRYFTTRTSGQVQAFDKSDLLHECMGSSATCFVKAFAAGLSDENVLIQRGFLELLVVYGSLSKTGLRSLTKTQRVELLYAAVQIVLRKDVGLNRRLWVWLTNTTMDNKTQSRFNEFAADDLAEALLQAIPTESVKMNKICLSLLDWDEIGGAIILKVFPSIIVATRQSQGKSNFADILISTKALVDAIHFDTICAYMQTLCSARDFVTAQFMLDHFQFNIERMPHSLPNLFLELLLSSHNERTALIYADTLSHFFDKSALQLEIRFKGVSSDGKAQVCDDSKDQLEVFGVLWLTACFSSLLEVQLNCDLIYRIVQRRLRLGPLDNKSCVQLICFVEDMLRLHACNILSFQHVEGVVSMLVYIADSCKSQLWHRFLDLCIKVAHHCWYFLGSDKLRYEIASVACFSSLARVIPIDRFEAFLSLLVAEELLTGNPIEKFAALWTHYRAKQSKDQVLRSSSILVFDSLAFGDGLQQSFILRWMLGSLTTMNHLLYVILQPICVAVPLHGEELTVLSTTCVIRPHLVDHDLATTKYFLELLRACLSKLGGEPLASLQTRFGADDFGIESSIHEQLLSDVETSNIFIGVASCALQIDLNDDPMAQVFYEHCIQIIILVAQTTGEKFDGLELILLHKLTLAIERKQYILQQVFLVHLHALCPGTAISPGLEGLFASILLHGLPGSRQHPVLQDFLRYCAARVDLNDKRNLTIVLQLTDCVIEQLNLNLIDIDAVLNTELAQETTTAHENVMLLLKSLNDFALPLAQAVMNNDQDDVSTSQPPSFLTGVLFTRAINAEQDGSTQNILNLSLPLRSIIEAAANVWLWAYRNSTSAYVATSYTAQKFLARSYTLMEQLSRNGSTTDTVEVLLAVWSDSTSVNRIGVQILCRTLIGDQLLATMSRILRASLSSQHFSNRRIREEHAYRNLTFLSVLLRETDDHEIINALPDITAFMRHFPLHLPMSIGSDVMLLSLATNVCAKINRIVSESLKKNKRELCDILIRIYTLVTTHHAIEDQESALGLALCQQIPFLPETLRDVEKTATLLSNIFVNAVQPGLRVDAARSISLRVLEKIVELPNTRKVWRRDVSESLYSESFFQAPGEHGAMWAPIIQKWISTEKEKLSDLLAKPNSTTPGQLFISSGAEQLQRLLQIKRLAFVEIALPMDSVSDKLDTFVSRMQDAVDSSGISHAMGLMLMQSIILRTSQVHIRDHIMNFIHLLQRSFLLLIESSTNPQPDTVLLCTTLRTLDVMLYLGNEDFQLHIWTFIEYLAQDDQTEVLIAEGQSLSSCLFRGLGRGYVGPPFQTLLRAPDALEMCVGDYLRNVTLLYRDWNLTSSRQPKDYQRVQGEILSQLFDAA